MADGETPTPSVPAAGERGKASGLAAEIRRVPIWVWFVIAVVFFVVYKTYFANSAVGNAAPADNSLASSGDTSTTGDTIGASSGAGVGASTTGPDPTTGSSSSGTGPTTQPASPPPSSSGGSSGGSGKGQTVYTIQPGDTLSGIGARFNVPWESIYQQNEAVIEQTAQQRSGHSSNGGMWIYPGERLVIP